MERLEKTFHSRKGFEMQVRAIRHFLARHNCKRRDLLFIAINEAVNNALFHGNGNDPSKSVRLRICKNNSKLHIFVEDEGKHLSKKIFLAHLTKSEENPLDEHGRGFLIITKCCERLSFPEPGTLCMTVALEKDNSKVQSLQPQP